MRIVHYQPTLALSEGGVVRAVIDLCKLLSACGHHVIIITHDRNHVASELHRPNASTPEVLVTRSPARWLGNFSRSQLDELYPMIASADVLHLHTPWLPANRQLSALSRAAGTPYALSLHGMLDDWSIGQKYLKKRAYLALLGRELLEHARVVHCTAMGELQQAEKWLSHQRMQVIPLAVDLSLYEDLPGSKLARAKFDLPNSVPKSAKLRTVLFLSRIHYKKGLDVLLKAIAEIDAESVSLRLLIAGSGSPSYMRKMRSLAEHLRISSIIQFLGPIDGELKRSLYQLADVFALPTSQENFGLVFAEALACATPVITTRHVDLWPELEESGGVVVAERTPTDFARKILGLLHDEKRRQAMGEAGRRWAFSYLNPATIRVRFEQMYREMMAVT